LLLIQHLDQIKSKSKSRLDDQYGLLPDTQKALDRATGNDRYCFADPQDPPGRQN
jgi:hypothetical protein